MSLVDRARQAAFTDTSLLVDDYMGDYSPTQLLAVNAAMGTGEPAKRRYPGWLTTLLEFNNSLTKGITFGLSDAFGITADEPAEMVNKKKWLRGFFPNLQYATAAAALVSGEDPLTYMTDYTFRPSKPGFARSAIRFTGELVGAAVPIVITHGAAAAGLTRLGGRLGYRPLMSAQYSRLIGGKAFPAGTAPLLHRASAMGITGLVSSSLHRVSDREPLAEALPGVAMETAFWAATPMATDLGSAFIRKFKPTRVLADKFTQTVDAISAKIIKRSEPQVPFPEEVRMDPYEASVLYKVSKGTRPALEGQRQIVSVNDFVDEEIAIIQSVGHQAREAAVTPQEKGTLTKVLNKIRDATRSHEVGPQDHILQIENALNEMHNEGVLNLKGWNTNLVHNLALRIRQRMMQAVREGMPRGSRDGAVAALREESPNVLGEGKRKLQYVANRLSQEAPLVQSNMISRIFRTIKGGMRSTGAVTKPVDTPPIIAQAEGLVDSTSQQVKEARALLADRKNVADRVRRQKRAIIARDEELTKWKERRYTQGKRRFPYGKDVTERRQTAHIEDEMAGPIVALNRSRWYADLGTGGRPQSNRPFDSWIRITPTTVRAQEGTAAPSDALTALFDRLRKQGWKETTDLPSPAIRAFSKEWPDIRIKAQVIDHAEDGLYIRVTSTKGHLSKSSAVIAAEEWDPRRDEAWHRILDIVTDYENSYWSVIQSMPREGYAIDSKLNEVEAAESEALTAYMEATTRLNNARSTHQRALGTLEQGAKSPAPYMLETEGRNQQLMGLSISIRDQLAEGLRAGKSRAQLISDVKSMLNSDAGIQASQAIKGRVYVAGPITPKGGHTFDENIKQATEAAEMLRKSGYEVFCPHEHAHLEKVLGSYEEALAWDISHLRDSDLIYLLPRWRQSPGAMAEYKEAKRLGIKTLTKAKIDPSAPKDAATEIAKQIVEREIYSGYNKLVFDKAEQAALEKAIVDFSSWSTLSPEHAQYLRNSLFYAVSDEGRVKAFIESGKILPNEYSVPMRTTAYEAVNADEAWFVRAIEQTYPKVDRQAAMVPPSMKYAGGRVGTHPLWKEIMAQHEAGVISDAEMDALAIIQRGMYGESAHPMLLQQHTGQTVHQLQNKLMRIPSIGRLMGEIPGIPVESTRTLMIRTGIRAADDPMLIKSEGGIRVVIDRKWVMNHREAATLEPSSEFPLGMYGIKGDVPLSHVTRIELDPALIGSETEATRIAGELRTMLKERGAEHVKVFDVSDDALIRAVNESMVVVGNRMNTWDNLYAYVRNAEAYSTWGDTIASRVVTRIKASNVNTDRQKLIVKAITETAGKTLTKGKTWQELTPVEQDLAVMARDIIDMGRQIITKHGLSTEELDKSWIPHMYRRWAELGGYGRPRGGPLGTESKFLIPTEFKTMEEAQTARDVAIRYVEKHGITPEQLLSMSKEQQDAAGIHRGLIKMLEAEPLEDMTYWLTSYIQSLHRAAASKNLIAELMTTNNEQGYKLVTTAKGIPGMVADAKNRYLPLNDIPGLRSLGWSWTGRHPTLRLENLYADPKAHALLTDLYAPKRYTDPFWDAVQKRWQLTHNTIKRLIMYNPLIHGWNVFSQAAMAHQLDMAATFKSLGLGKKGWEMPEELMMQPILHGWQPGRVSAAHELGSVFDEALDRAAAEGILDKTFWGSIKNRAAHTKEIADSFLWDTIVRNLSLGTYWHKFHQWKSLYPAMTDDEIGVMAASFANDSAGLLPKYLMRNGWRWIGNFAFFARNWTYSNLRLLWGAISGGRSVFRGMTPEMRATLQTEYTVDIWNGVTGFLTYANLLQMMVTGKPIWQNPPGHKTDIDTGAIDPAGRKVFIVNPVFRYIRDYMHFFGVIKEPTSGFRIALNKMAPELRAGLELALNKESWTGEEIYSKSEDVDYRNKLMDMGAHVFRSVTPIRTFTGQRGKEQLPGEKLLPIMGTWVVHGMAGGEWGRQLMNFEQALGYQRNRLRPEIARYVQRGELNEAVRFAQQHGLPVSSIAYEQKKLAAPLRARWNNMSRKDRVLFMQSLSAQDRAEFRRELATGG